LTATTGGEMFRIEHTFPFKKMPHYRENGGCPHWPYNGAVASRMQSDPALKRAFNQYNKKYFKNRLMSDMIVRWRQWPDEKTVALFGQGGFWTIQINIDVSPFECVWRLALLHEMAHAATNDETLHHGPRWRREMQRLAKAGAFNKLW